jgi:hypothetical protein
MQIWGKDHCHGVHPEFKQMMFGKWSDKFNGQLYTINMANMIDSSQPKCHTVYSN